LEGIVGLFGFIAYPMDYLMLMPLPDVTSVSLLA
jgi:hypothetical protein